jgi:hypothetical protein
MLFFWGPVLRAMKCFHIDGAFFFSHYLDGMSSMYLMWKIWFHPSLNTKFDNWKNEQSGICRYGFFCEVKSPAICGGDRRVRASYSSAPHWVWPVCGSVPPPHPNWPINMNYEPYSIVTPIIYWHFWTIVAVLPLWEECGISAVSSLFSHYCANFPPI